MQIVTCLGSFWRPDGRQFSPSGQVLLKNRSFWSPRLPRQPLLKGYMKQWHGPYTHASVCCTVLYHISPQEVMGRYPRVLSTFHLVKYKRTICLCLCLWGDVCHYFSKSTCMHVHVCECFLSKGTHFVRAGCPHLKEVS